MPTLDEVVRSETALDEAALAWVRRLVGEWRLLSDLSFADLVLWLPTRDGSGFVVGAQQRPSTSPTAFVDDLVGTRFARGRRPLMDDAFDTGRVRREGDPEWWDDIPVRVEAIPVRLGDRVIGVVARNTNLVSVRTPSRLELVYLQCAAQLARMVAEGRFPRPGEQDVDWDASRGAPNVGDGLIHLDVDGRVRFASPNAVSAYRRAGLATDLVGQSLAEVTLAMGATTVSGDLVLDLASVLSGRRPWRVEVALPGETPLTLTSRVIPLEPGGRHEGAVVLVRDITDLRRREQQLISKEATIREIHHRVKNNLQTVASLLRLQSRRVQDPAARVALEEAVGRVAAIAVVHDTLSQTADEDVDMDDVIDRLGALIVDMARGDPRAALTVSRLGSAGNLPAVMATPVAMVLTELLQNAVEHGSRDGRGHVVVTAERTSPTLVLVVDDEGPGLPDGFDPERSDRLGLRIVRTLVEERGGQIGWSGNAEGGTRVRIVLPVPQTPGASHDPLSG